MSTRPDSYRVAPYDLARKHGEWKGRIPIDCFTRLNQYVQGAAFVEIELAFALDDEDRPFVTGLASTRVQLPCQRCLLQVEVALDVVLRMRLTHSDIGAGQRDEGDDIVIISEQKASVVDLVEDDLLLSIPGQICPAPEDCSNAPVMEYPADGSSDSPAPSKENPFQVLERLRNGGSD